MAVITNDDAGTSSSMAVIVAIIAVIAIAAIAFLFMQNRAGITTTPGTNVNLPGVNVQNPLPQSDAVPGNGQ